MSIFFSFRDIHIACEMDLHPVPCTSCLRKLTVDAFLKNPKDLTSKVLKTCCHCRERKEKAYHSKKDQGKKRQFGDELDANARPEKQSKRIINMEPKVFWRIYCLMRQI
jgi:hypothetical protein